MAPAVSVVNSTSRVRSKRRVTSLRLAIASDARACAAADRLLAMTATTRNAKSAIQFCGSAMVNVPSGGRKKKLSTSIAAPDTTMAAHRRPTVAVARTTRRKASETVVGLTPGSNRSTAAAAANDSRLAMRTARSRRGIRRMSAWLILTSRHDRLRAADFLSPLYGFLTRSRHIVTAMSSERPSYEVDSAHINAPHWPWAVAGWTMSALHILFFVAAWIHRSA